MRPLCHALLCAALVTSTAAPARAKERIVDDSPEAARLLAELDSPDAEKRVHAARELSRLHHPKALEAALKTLGDGADKLRPHFTPAVQLLIDLGKPALPALYDRLESEDVATRWRAFFAVSGIISRLFGWSGGRWPEGAQDRYEKFWREIGYRPDADAATRNDAVKKLRAWRAP
jgi:HEAT repeats